MQDYYGLNIQIVREEMNMLMAMKVNGEETETEREKLLRTLHRREQRQGEGLHHKSP